MTPRQSQVICVLWLTVKHGDKGLCQVTAEITSTCRTGTVGHYDYPHDAGIELLLGFGLGWTNRFMSGGESRRQPTNTESQHKRCCVNKLGRRGGELCSSSTMLSKISLKVRNGRERKRRLWCLDVIIMQACQGHEKECCWLPSVPPWCQPFTDRHVTEHKPAVDFFFVNPID